MKLTEIRIEEFGKLQNFSLTPGEGLTLIEGGNESGKSTLLAFLRFVLYGFPRKGAGVDGEERDKRLSWYTRRAAGSLTLKAGDGEVYRVSRAFGVRGTPGRENPVETLSVVHLPYGEEVPLGDKTPGEYFLGLPVELYLGSLCVNQSEAERVSADGMSTAVGGLLFSGEAGFSAANAEKKLEEARRELQHIRGRGGKIADLEDGISALNGEIAEAERNAASLQALQAERLRTARERGEIQARLEELKEGLERRHLEETLCRFSEFHEAEALLVSARDRKTKVLAEYGKAADAFSEETVTALRVDFSSLAAAERELSGNAAENAGSLPQTEEEKAIGEKIVSAGGSVRMAKKYRARRRAGKILGVVSLVLTALAGVGAAEWFFGAERFRETPALLLASLGALAAAFLLVIPVFRIFASEKALFSALGVKDPAMLRSVLETRLQDHLACAAAEKKKEEAEEKQAWLRRRRDDLLSGLRARVTALGGKDFGTTAEAETEIRALVDRTREAREKIAEAKTAETNAGIKVETLRRTLSGQDEVTLRARARELPLLEGETAFLEAEYRDAEGRFNGADAADRDAARRETALSAVSRDPALLYAEREKYEKELREATLRLNAVNMAGEALAEAKDALRRGVTPRLAEEASRTFALLTGGAYDTLHVGTDFALSLDAAGTSLPLSRFSAGCRDAAHLSLRLSLLGTLSDERLPLFLDEAMARLDDERAHAFLRVMEKYAEAGGQCLLFTCHTREGEWLTGDGAPAARVKL